jgi:hypothetical protein
MSCRTQSGGFLLDVTPIGDSSLHRVFSVSCPGASCRCPSALCHVRRSVPECIAARPGGCGRFAGHTTGQKLRRHSPLGKQLQVGRCQANRPERQRAVGFPRVLVHRALPLPEGCPVNDPRNRWTTCSLRFHRRRWGCAGRRYRGVSSGAPTRLPLDHSGPGNSR